MFVELTVVNGYRNDVPCYEKRVVNMRDARMFRVVKIEEEESRTLIEFEGGMNLDVAEAPRKILAMLYGADHVRRLSPTKDE